jgi:predicted AAA+ superfamily ATPase
MAIEECIHAAKPDEAFFWATHQGAEIDLLLVKRGRLIGIECKYTDMPRVTPSMLQAIDELGLERITVLYPGTRRIPLHAKIEAMPLSKITKGMKDLFA